MKHKPKYSETVVSDLLAAIMSVRMIAEDRSIPIVKRIDSITRLCDDMLSKSYKTSN